ncbi:hypothetical protein ACWELB_21270 [Streptomyces asiaticus]
MARRIRKPWRVVLTRPGGETRTEHTSQREAYEVVIAERAKLAEGLTEVTSICVYEYEDGWALYEDALERL